MKSYLGHTRSERAPAPTFDLVVMAASLGGLEALGQVLSALPEGFPVPVLTVIHRSSSSRNALAELLGSRTKLQVKEGRQGEHPRAGTVYLAPPDRHLLLGANGRLSLSDAPKVCFSRPSADRLFQSAAERSRHQLIGVILTGRLQDGAAGVKEIKRAGGRVLAQDMATSRAYGMPGAAVATGCVDYVLPLNSIAPALVTLVMVPGAARLFEVAAGCPVRGNQPERGSQGLIPIGDNLCGPWPVTRTLRQKPGGGLTMARALLSHLP